MNFQVLNRSCCAAARKYHVSSVRYKSKPSSLIDSIIRVDHAGELGADRIYAGQMAILGNTKAGPVIQHMWDQEKAHKAAFEKLIVEYRVRPTAFIPIWNVAGFLLGAGTALMGEKAAMACTVAVESVIVEHYNDQLRTLMEDPEKNQELMKTIQKFRDDEQEHHDSGIDHGAEQAPFYKALTEIIKCGCRTAIAISKDLFSNQRQYNYVISRNYSTRARRNSNEEKSKWDLYGAVCIQRKPLIQKPLTDLELKVREIIFQKENEKSYKSDHEIRAEEDMKQAELYKTEGFAAHTNLDVILKQTAHEFEEASNNEYDSFKAAPTVTIADKENDVKSIYRKLEKHLFLLVYKTIGNDKKWILPHVINKKPETMRQTANRAAIELCGNDLRIKILGNAPSGFYKYLYPKKVRSDTIGAKIFFYKAYYISGTVTQGSAEPVDYQWVTRSDLNKLLEKKYFKKLSNILINDDEIESEKASAS